MGGTIYQAVMDQAGHLPWLQDYMNGKTERPVFRQELLKNRDQLAALGLSDWWISLLARFPSNPRQSADLLLDRLSAADIIRNLSFIRNPSFDEQAFLDYHNKIKPFFTHLPDRFTSIFPEETRSAYALSCALKPRRIFVAGSYYGYLAVWLIAGLARDGEMICSDVDPTVCALARQNMQALGESSRVKVICEDAEQLLNKTTDPIDLFVLDAYGGRNHPNPLYHGKAIYGPLLKAALPRLHEKSILLVHNAEQGAGELAGFFKMTEKAKFSLYLNTTDNLAVYQL